MTSEERRRAIEARARELLKLEAEAVLEAYVNVGGPAYERYKKEIMRQGAAVLRDLLEELARAKAEMRIWKRRATWHSETYSRPSDPTPEEISAERGSGTDD
jgi:hypothetical protein